MNKTIITWVGMAAAVSLAVIVIVAAVNSRAKQQPAAYTTNLGSARAPQGTALAPTLPGLEQSTLQPLSGQAASESASSRLYRNQAFDFELSYPAEFGEVTAETFSPDTKDVCVKRGSLVLGTFTKNLHLDFGLPTPDFTPCPNSANPIFAVKQITVSGKDLRLEFGEFRDAVTVPLEATIPSASPGVVAYVFANRLDKHADGEAAAVVSSPHPTLGHPVFRTHGLSLEDGIKLLQKVIAQ